MRGLADLDELVLKCRTERSHALIEEAVASYRAGAYRASIVSSWIAVQFDLIDKFRELALQGDAQAKLVISEFDKFLDQLDQGNHQAIGKALEFERNILSTARDKFQLLDAQQFTDMRRLQNDRNRCAHPTYQRGDSAYQPSAELARTHLRNSVLDVLSQPPVQGRSAIDAVIAQVTSAYFPKKGGDVQALLKSGPLGRPNPVLINGAIDTLFWGLFLNGSPLKNNAAAVKALAAVISMHREIAEPRLRSQSAKFSVKMSDQEIPIFIILACEVPEAFYGCGAPQKDTLHRFIREAPVEKIHKLIGLTVRTDIFSASSLERVSASDLTDLSKMILAGLRKEALPRAIDIFATAGAWATANSAADLLVIPLIEHISVADIQAIVRSPRERGSDLRSSGGLARFIRAVRDHNIMQAADLDKLLHDENMSYLVE